MADRTNIYYWKCDRDDAFHGTSDYTRDQAAMLVRLARVLEDRFGSVENLEVGCGQGNHRTFTARIDGQDVFIRTEDGIERDDYIAVEAEVTRRVAAVGVQVPQTIAYDCSRKCGFAWQVLPYVPFRDLNSLVKDGTLVWDNVAGEIGRAIASWQEISVSGFGPFSASRAMATGDLQALQPTLEAYFRLNLVRHLDYLVRNDFIDAHYAARIMCAVDDHAVLLKCDRGVLVHKDLAVWNIMGTETEVKGFVDWDDCIMGDAMDDLSLMGVTANAPETRQIVSAYAAMRPLSAEAAGRFWLAWLRNIVFKAVIRVGAGYFKKAGDEFFLIGGGKDGSDLETTTRDKIEQALNALEKGRDFDAI